MPMERSRYFQNRSLMATSVGGAVFLPWTREDGQP